MAATDALRPDDAQVVTDSRGQIADASLVAHSARLAPQLHTVADGIWCVVGNGLSNQTFITAPDGLIAIDTGESREEMAHALTLLRTVTDTPVVAVLYTHFHYISGTTALTDSEPVTEIWGHQRIAENLQRSATEIAPAYGRGLVQQFGIQLPESGPDGIVNVGLGRAYRMAEHAPFTPGYVPATHVIDGATTITVAGLQIEVMPAPSDADDSVTYWFPTLDVAVHNLLWPALFNVFAIRGEEYRDPRILLDGLDHLWSLQADNLVGTHGPPLSGREDISQRLRRYRDSIQFLWDQTVRWTNRGATSAELAHRVALPDIFDDDWLTQQHYGIAEHHTRQIRTGLFGFFDGDPLNLLPLDRPDHATHTIDAMGGLQRVRELCTDAIDTNIRWGLHLASLLAAHPESTDTDRGLLATALRIVARRTPSANIRNWCLTTARELDGALDMSRHRTHRLSRRQLATWDLITTAHVLRVMVNPENMVGVDLHLAVDTETGRCGLHLRHHILAVTDGADADATLRCTRETWDQMLAATCTLSDALNSGDVAIDGDRSAVLHALNALDHPAFATGPDHD